MRVRISALLGPLCDAPFGPSPPSAAAGPGVPVPSVLAPALSDGTVCAAASPPRGASAGMPTCGLVEAAAVAGRRCGGSSPLSSSAASSGGASGWVAMAGATLPGSPSAD